MQVYALTSSQSPRETLDLFLTLEAARKNLEGGQLVSISSSVV
jgi:hypothetical protein